MEGGCVNVSTPRKHRSYGDALKSAREAAGLSQRALAERVGVSAAYISQLETGHGTGARKKSRTPSEELHAALVVELGSGFEESVPQEVVQGLRNAQRVYNVAHSSAPPLVRGRAQADIPDSLIQAWTTLMAGLGPEDAEHVMRWFQRIATTKSGALIAAMEEVQAETEELKREGLYTALDAARTLLRAVNAKGVLPEELVRAVEIVLSFDHELLPEVEDAMQLVVVVLNDVNVDRELVRHALVQTTRSLAAPVDDDATKVGLMPLGQRGHIWLNHIGLDGEGLWINPHASLVQGSDRQDPTVTRHTDGTLWVNTGSLEGPTVPARDPAKHTVPVRHAYMFPGDLPNLAAYARTVIRTEVPGGGDNLVVARGEVESDEGDFPSGYRAVYFITASNPSGRFLTDEENAHRTQELRATVEQQFPGCDIAMARTVPDQAWSSEQHPEPTGLTGAPVEDAVALYVPEDTTVDEGAVLELASRFEQSSIFRWTPSRRAVITLDGSVLQHGWQLLAPQGDEN